MKNERPFKIALVGCGAVSKLYYTPALKELENKKIVRVHTLFDPEPKNTAYIKTHFPDAIVVENIEELSAANIDIAIIASPPQFHSQQAITLLNSGISVLCEKPMASSVYEAELMIEAAASTKMLLAIGHFRRFFPATQTIKKILSLNILGDIKSFSFSEGGIFRWPVQSSSYFKKSVSKGGVLLDIGVHLIDLMIWWFGTPTEIIYEDDAMGGIEVNCRFRCSFNHAFSGEVRLSRDTILPNQYRIEGTKGWLTWNVNDASDKVQMGLNDSSFVLDAQIHEPDPYNSLMPGVPAHNFQQSFISQILNMVDALENKTSLMVPGEEGIKSLKIIEYCYHNRKLMQMPWLSASELNKAHHLNNQIT